MSSVSVIPEGYRNDFRHHEDAIDVLYRLLGSIAETLDDYAGEKLTGTQALHSCIAVIGQNDELIKSAIVKAAAEAALQYGLKYARRYPYHPGE